MSCYKRNCYKCAYDTWAGKFGYCIWEIKEKYGAKNEKNESETDFEKTKTNEDEQREKSCSCTCSFASAKATFAFLNL